MSTNGNPFVYFLAGWLCMDAARFLWRISR